MKAYNIRKQMELEFSKDKEDKPVSYVSFIHQAKGDKALAQEMADNHNERMKQKGYLK